MRFNIENQVFMQGSTKMLKQLKKSGLTALALVVLTASVQAFAPQTGKVAMKKFVATMSTQIEILFPNPTEAKSVMDSFTTALKSVTGKSGQELDEMTLDTVVSFDGTLRRLVATKSTITDLTPNDFMTIAKRVAEHAKQIDSAVYVCSTCSVPAAVKETGMPIIKEATDSISAARKTVLKMTPDSKKGAFRAYAKRVGVPNDVIDALLTKRAEYGISDALFENMLTSFRMMAKGNRAQKQWGKSMKSYYGGHWDSILKGDENRVFLMNMVGFTDDKMKTWSTIFKGQINKAGNTPEERLLALQNYFAVQARANDELKPDYEYLRSTGCLGFKLPVL